jgi:hypothetical protein
MSDQRRNSKGNPSRPSKPTKSSFPSRPTSTTSSSRRDGKTSPSQAAMQRKSTHSRAPSSEAEVLSNFQVRRTQCAPSNTSMKRDDELRRMEGKKRRVDPDYVASGEESDSDSDGTYEAVQAIARQLGFHVNLSCFLHLSHTHIHTISIVSSLALSVS